MTENPGDRVATVSGELADFIVNDLNWDGTTADLLSDDPVQLPAVLDSADLLELAGFLEDTYGISIDDEEIVAETFASVRLVAEFVVSKQQEAQSSQ